MVSECRLVHAAGVVVGDVVSECRLNHAEICRAVN